VIVKSFNPLSVGKVLGLTYACLGLLIGGFVSLFALAAGGGPGGRGGPEAVVMGAGAVVMLPLIYGVIGFIGGLISAFIYNVIAGLAGGIEVELVDPADVGRGGRYRPRRDREDDDW
jgi:hypothetical protein